MCVSVGTMALLRYAAKFAIWQHCQVHNPLVFRPSVRSFATTFIFSSFEVLSAQSKHDDDGVGIGWMSRYANDSFVILSGWAAAAASRLQKEEDRRSRRGVGTVQGDTSPGESQLGG